MIGKEERSDVAKLFHINYPLNADTYRSEKDSERIYKIRYFWIAHFRTFLDYPWLDLMVYLIKDDQDYYGGLTYPDYNLDKTEFKTIKPIHLIDWNDTVANCFHNIDLFVDEEPGSIFGNGTSYSFMLESTSITTNIDVSLSMEIRPSINNLSSELASTIKQLIKLYGNDLTDALLIKE